MLGQTDIRKREITLVNTNGVTFDDMRQLAVALTARGLPPNIELEFYPPNSTVPVQVGRIVIRHEEPIEVYQQMVVDEVMRRLSEGTTTTEPTTTEPEPEPEPEPTTTEPEPTA